MKTDGSTKAPKWEIRGASAELRERVRAAAHKASMTQSAWVKMALEAQLAVEAGRSGDIGELKFEVQRLKRYMKEMDEGFAGRVKEVMAAERRRRLNPA